ncbi:MAG: hypothetical protein CUN54_06275 [Phototrophicales bacterium]|nr:MAG: hypothetical protein CUN54_06275 [Phototrophicales bacterium]
MAVNNISLIQESRAAPVPRPATSNAARLPRRTSPKTLVAATVLMLFALILATRLIALLPSTLQPDIHRQLFDFEPGDTIHHLDDLPCEWVYDFELNNNGICTLTDWQYDGKIQIQVSIARDGLEYKWRVTSIVFYPDALTVSDLYAMYGHPLRWRRFDGWVSMRWADYHAGIAYDDVFTPNTPVYTLTML